LRLGRTFLTGVAYRLHDGSRQAGAEEVSHAADRGALIRRSMFWLPIAFFGGIGLLMAIFGRH
jgi:hypothetical protein